MQPKRIVFVAALVVLVGAIAGSVPAGHSDALRIAGYGIVNDAVVVSVYNSGRETQQGVLRVEIRHGSSSVSNLVAVSVPPGATVPVAMAIPRDWSEAAVKIDARLATQGSNDDGGAGAPADLGGNPHLEGNQITEGPDTVGG